MPVENLVHPDLLKMNDSTMSNVGDSKHGQEAPDREDATKKLAQQGQWRTPPLPVFTASANIPPQGASADGGASSALPTSADEYALMLQEAYKRGQQAGALSSHPTGESDGTTTLPSSVPTRTSCRSSLRDRLYYAAKRRWAGSCWPCSMAACEPR